MNNYGEWFLKNHYDVLKNIYLYLNRKINIAIIKKSLYLAFKIPIYTILENKSLYQAKHLKIAICTI